MLRSTHVIIRDKEVIDNIRETQIDLMVKINNLVSLTGKEKKKIIDRINGLKFYHNTNKRISRRIGSMYKRHDVMELTNLGMNLTNKVQRDIIAHEICHLIANAHYGKCVGHSSLFKSLCRALGYGHIANATTPMDTTKIVKRV